MDKINIQTTQNVPITYEIASVGDRILAYLLDMLVLMGYSLIIALGYSFKPMSEDTVVIFGILFILPFMFYSLACESLLNGQSIGKRARKIKVISLNGKEVSLSNYLIRWLFRIIDVIPYGVVAIITIILNGKGQRLGDIAAGTAVVKITKREDFDTNLFNIPIQDYELVFSEADQLSEKDILLIKQSLKRQGTENYALILEKLALKIKALLHIETKMNNEKFLYTIMKDYNHLNGNL